MIVRDITAGKFALASWIIATLAGCAANPLGPTVAVMPGPGKAFETFQSDNATCKSFADEQVKGQADAANKRAAGTALLSTILGAGLGAATGGISGNAGGGAAVGAAVSAGAGSAIGGANSSNEQLGIQQQYDNAFSQCMYAHGDQVPGYAPVVAYAPSGPAAVAPPDPLVRSTQAELIRLGYLRGGADGYIGSRTRTAIISFEQATGLPAEGSVSPRLLAKLQSTPTASPTASSASTTAASAPPNWVAPTTATVAAAPTASSGWVAPTK